ncbi:MAG: universal stress protein [Actinomycetes bacterium]
MTVPSLDRILVAVDNSPAALAAVRTAARLAAVHAARVRVVHVLGDDELVQALVTMGRDGTLRERRSREAAALLGHMASIARRAGVQVDTVDLDGEAAPRILEQARDWQADLLVMGRSDRRGPGQPYVGTVTRHVLEFAERPVLVVPQPAAAR